MQSSYHYALLSLNELDRQIQERVKSAEHYALLRELKRNRVSRFAVVRKIVGLATVRLGTWISGSAPEPEGWVDVPVAPAR